MATPFLNLVLKARDDAKALSLAFGNIPRKLTNHRRACIFSAKVRTAKILHK
jgi:hypothetical protein